MAHEPVNRDRLEVRWRYSKQCVLSSFPRCFSLPFKSAQQGPRSIPASGQIIVRHHPEIEYGPGKYTVVTPGDGTCDPDSVAHGLLWMEEDGELFRSALKTRKANMSDHEWLSKASAEAEARILAHSRPRSNATDKKARNACFEFPACEPYLRYVTS